MAVQAVIFDWGGTLTPWRTMDLHLEWRSVAAVAAEGDPELTDRLTADLTAAAAAVWSRARDEHVSASFEQIVSAAGVTVADAHVAAYRAFWDPATRTDPDVRPLWEGLGADGIAIGVLSNTLWPRTWHDDIFRRDGVLDLIDGAVYSSEIPWTKPHPEAFRAALDAVGVDEPNRSVFVGDRLFDDIWGAGSFGMKTVHVPHSDIPPDQVGHSEGIPDAVVHRLAEVASVIADW